MTIIKPLRPNTEYQDPRQRAGANAERQMAHYLHRRFSEDREVCVLHDLRIVDQKQPEYDGSPGACQIDHLIVHRWGMFIVETKSVIEEVRVRPDGTGGDEWSRMYQGKEMGMPSPIRQAERQAEFLRSLLKRQKNLLGKLPVGLRTFSKITFGTDQRGFGHVPIQLIIAISDTGRIRRMHGWKEPQNPFPVYVTKSDLVTYKIDGELKRHRKGMNLLNTEKTGEHGLWAMEKEEVHKVAEFLAELHKNRSVDSAAKQSRPVDAIEKSKSSLDEAVRTPDRTEAVCKHCGAKNLNARWSKYGYYWKCGECGKNTGISSVCSACGAKGGRNKTVKIRKIKKQYFRDCKACDTSEMIWSESKSSLDEAVRTPDRTEAVCKHCNAKNLNARWSKYGYYWKCGECGKNTGISSVCSACGAKGGRNKTVKIRKKKKQYLRDCKACDTSEVIWSEQ